MREEMISCEKILVLSVIFERKLDVEDGKVEIHIDVELNYAANKKKSEKNAKLEMLLTVGSKEKDQIPLYFSIRLAGIFGWESMTEQEAEGEINSQGAEVLMSFARTYLYDMMCKAGMEGIVLPLERFE